MEIYSAVVQGVNPHLIKIELAVTLGIPGVQMTGMPGLTVRDSKDRWLAALGAMGIKLPGKKHILNLQPSEIKKEGTHLDLAIAFSLGQSTLRGNDASAAHGPKRIGLLGELSLDGDILASTRQYGLARFMMAQDLEWLFVPASIAGFFTKQQRKNMIPVKTIQEVFESYLKLASGCSAFEYIETEKTYTLEEVLVDHLDFSDVKRQEIVKRALVYAVAGRHHTLLTGPPGSGKSMMAKRIPTIQPEMDRNQVEQALAQRSLLSSDFDLNGFSSQREPMQTPHASASVSAILGGSQSQSIGEAVLANGGVLFMDELLEYKRDVLESLRGPLEDKTVSVSKANYKATLPADFTLIATTNPCRCGYYGFDPRCVCNEMEVKRYRNRLSGPLLDRFAINLAVGYGTNASKEGSNCLNSHQMKTMVKHIRSIQEARYGGKGKSAGNVSESEFLSVLSLSQEAQAYLESEAFTESGDSFRRQKLILRLAQTIADEKSEVEVSLTSFLEAKYLNQQCMW